MKRHLFIVRFNDGTEIYIVADNIIDAVEGAETQKRKYVDVKTVESRGLVYVCN